MTNILTVESSCCDTFMCLYPWDWKLHQINLIKDMYKNQSYQIDLVSSQWPITTVVFIEQHLKKNIKESKEYRREHRFAFVYCAVAVCIFSCPK